MTLVNLFRQTTTTLSTGNTKPAFLVVRAGTVRQVMAPPAMTPSQGQFMPQLTDPDQYLGSRREEGGVLSRHPESTGIPAGLVGSFFGIWACCSGNVAAPADRLSGVRWSSNRGLRLSPRMSRTSDQDRAADWALTEAHDRIDRDYQSHDPIDSLASHRASNRLSSRHAFAWRPNASSFTTAHK